MLTPVWPQVPALRDDGVVDGAVTGTVVEEAEVKAAVVLGGVKDALMKRWLDKPHTQDRGTREV